jgi:hypothetical protein
LLQSVRAPGLVGRVEERHRQNRRRSPNPIMLPVSAVLLYTPQAPER